jgi:hypothetical protein
MRTAKRLNLPDDDVLFLYIGAIEYTVQLCEDILGGIRQERQSISQSALDTQTASQEQAETIIKNLIQVALAATADIQTSGMAATSAIAEANSEVLNQSRATVGEAQQLKDQIQALRASVDKDRETNENVLKVLLERMGQSIGGLNTAIKQINKASNDIQKLQQGTALVKFADWFSPLFALLVALIVGFGGGWWAMWLKYSEPDSVLGRRLVQWNIERILKCQQDNNPKCTIWILPPPEQ